jgi:hypothetical protein
VPVLRLRELAVLPYLASTRPLAALAHVAQPSASIGSGARRMSGMVSPEPVDCERGLGAANTATAAARPAAADANLTMMGVRGVVER